MIMTADATLYLRRIHEQVKARETTMAKEAAKLGITDAGLRHRMAKIGLPPIAHRGPATPTGTRPVRETPIDPLIAECVNRAMAEGQRMIAADKARRARLLACCGGM